MNKGSYVEINEKRQSEVYILERIYFIDGLDCANCAAKLERHLCEVPYFDQVIIDFMAKKLIVSVFIVIIVLMMTSIKAS